MKSRKQRPRRSRGQSASDEIAEMRKVQDALYNLKHKLEAVMASTSDVHKHLCHVGLMHTEALFRRQRA